MEPNYHKGFVHGADFSGAQDAGTKIWIACGDISNDVILISECFPAQDLPKSGRLRDPSMRALRAFIRKQRDSVFGLDFPFGLPHALFEGETWEEWVVAFSDRYTSPEGYATWPRTVRSLEGSPMLRLTPRFHPIICGFTGKPILASGTFLGLLYGRKRSVFYPYKSPGMNDHGLSRSAQPQR